MSDPKFVAETPQDRENRLAGQKVEQVQPIDIKSYMNVYEFETTLPGSGQVIKFRPVTTGQMKRLLVYEQADSSKEIENALDELITSCVVSPDFNISELYLQDRFFLLLQIRAKTKGNTYSFQWTCPVCRLPQPAAPRIDELEVKPLKEITTLVDVTPQLQADFVFPTRAIQQKAFECANLLADKTETERLYEVGLYTYALCMSTFHTPVGKTQPSLEDKYAVLNGVGTDVLERIQKWLSENEFGVDFSVDVGCANPDCKFTHKMEIPVTDFFV